MIILFSSKFGCPYQIKKILCLAVLEIVPSHPLTDRDSGESSWNKGIKFSVAVGLLQTFNMTVTKEFILVVDALWFIDWDPTRTNIG